MAPSRVTHYSRFHAFVARRCGIVRPATGLCVNNDRDTSGRTFADMHARLQESTRAYTQLTRAVQHSDQMYALERSQWTAIPMRRRDN